MSSLPSTFRPQLATLVGSPPEGDRYLHEIKYDGYRMGCRVDRGRVSLISRNGLDWTGRFPEIAEAVRALPVRTALLDGEVAIVGPDGRTSFQALQNALGETGRDDLVFFAFDLLFLDGEDLTSLNLDTRKARLAALLGRAADTGRVRYSSHVEGEGGVVLAHACALGLEGIVSKRRDEPYRPGRNTSWLKSKCIARQEFVIGGFTDPEGSRQGIGALLVGYYEHDARFVFAGKVGTGFTEKVARQLRGRLDAMEQPKTPFSGGPKGWQSRNAHWVRPVLVAEVTFTEWTRDGKIRHPSFQGLRQDKRPKDVRRERATGGSDKDVTTATASAWPGARSTTPKAQSAVAPTAAKAVSGVANRGSASRLPRTRKRAAARAQTTAKAARERAAERTSAAGTRRAPVPARTPKPPPSRKASGERRPVVAGVGISHPDRPMFAASPLTKVELARFYESIGEWMVPHVQGRPLTLVRCPDGATAGCFYMKHSKVWAPAPLRRVDIREKTKVGEYLVADDVAGLVALVQMNVLEVHTWNSRVDHVEQPDRLVFDIDPGPEVAWKQVADAARLVRTLLERVSLRSFVKTTGGRGLHVVVPIEPDRDWSECLAFARTLAEIIARDAPGRYTTAFSKAGREDKILIDYLRNNRTNTSVAAYSTRARPGAPVSVPLRWEELTPRLDPARFTATTIGRRLERIGTDPWADYWTTRQSLISTVTAALAAL